MMGTRSIRTVSRTAGRRPVTTPKIVLGMSKMKERKGSLSIREVMFEMAPMAATGIDQKRMMTEMIAVAR